MLFNMEFHKAIESIAYLDGGSASMLFQAAMGGLLTGAYYVSTRWKAVKAFVQHIATRK